MFDWVRAEEGQELPSTAGGASGYFSAPAKTLDPALFDANEFLKMHAKHAILRPILDYLEGGMNLANVMGWVHIWLAGSGITYQWDGDRGNGDLDVMVGMDRQAFNSANPDFEWLGNAELANYLNGLIRANLWPQTAHTVIGTREYEVTYFLTVTDDIKTINPYAAYNVMRNQWVVRPPEHTATARDFPRDWLDKATDDVNRAEYLARHYQRSLADYEASTNEAGRATADAMLKFLSGQATMLFDDIHTSRRLAFQGGGLGYLDPHNFRWQEAKANGVVNALSAISGARQRAQESSDADLYGGSLEGAEALTARAMLYRRPQ